MEEWCCSPRTAASHSRWRTRRFHGLRHQENDRNDNRKIAWPRKIESDKSCKQTEIDTKATLNRSELTARERPEGQKTRRPELREIETLDDSSRSKKTVHDAKYDRQTIHDAKNISEFELDDDIQIISSKTRDHTESSEGLNNHSDKNGRDNSSDSLTFCNSLTSPDCITLEVEKRASMMEILWSPEIVGWQRRGQGTWNQSEWNNLTLIYCVRD